MFDITISFKQISVGVHLIRQYTRNASSANVARSTRLKFDALMPNISEVIFKQNK